MSIQGQGTSSGDNVTLNEGKAPRHDNWNWCDNHSNIFSKLFLLPRKPSEPHQKLGDQSEISKQIEESDDIEDGFEVIDGPVDCDWKSKYKESQKRLKAMENENEKVKREVTELRNENQMLKKKNYPKKQQAQIQILYRHGGGHLQEAVRELESRLSRTLDHNMITLVHCKKASDVQQHIPLLIVCLNASRLAVDAQVAIQDLHDLRKAALLIIHHKDIHNLPVKSSEKALKGNEYQDLRCIVDFAFLREKGIYRCDMNEHSEETVVNFINTSVDKETKKPLISKPDLA